MKAEIFAFTRRGARLATLVKEVLQEHSYQVNVYTKQEFTTVSPSLLWIEPDLKTVISRVFSASSLLVFIGASGIAVRAVAPYIRDKKQDPAVICMDEKGQYVIPLLSGHIGGANRIAQVIAHHIGSQAIITTATDINGLISIDEWAVRNNLYISDMDIAKRVSAALVDDQDIGLFSDFEITGEIPRQLLPKVTYQTGICISLEEFKKPFSYTLSLIPRIACLGIGCRKGVSVATIEETVLEVLHKNKISIKALCGIASIDLKKDEEGLLEFAKRYDLPITFYSPDQLNTLTGDFTASDYVAQVSGTDNVCERAAVLLSLRGKLVFPKFAKNGVTIALALKQWRVNFDD